MLEAGECPVPSACIAVTAGPAEYSGAGKRSGKGAEWERVTNCGETYQPLRPGCSAIFTPSTCRSCCSA